jgi:hypothetical protein
MVKMILRMLTLSCAVGTLFVLLFTLLQNEHVYSSTLGKISSNYERSGTKRDVRILNVQKPYVGFNSESVNHWDAALYKQVRDKAYESGARLAKEKLAFYPLFPLLWKLSRIDSELIVYCNYLLFVIGLILLAVMLMGETARTPLFFLFALLVPTAVTYYLPYAESLFLLTMAIAVWGIFKKNYWIYFVGAMLFCMTRPACMIFMVALLAADFMYWVRHGNFKHFGIEFARKITPCVLGLGTVTIVQFLYTGSWTAYFDSMELWPAESGMFNLITDWSLEGFGMSVFAIFFLAIPALIYLAVWSWKSLRSYGTHTPDALFGDDQNVKKDYLLHLSLLFVGGNLAYTILTSGNIINGFSRYTMAVPFFYMILFLLPEKMQGLSAKNKLLFFCLCLAGMGIFLRLIVYGGQRFRFQYTGLLLCLILSFFFLFEQHLPSRTKWVILAVLSIPCVLWHTYLFNMFLSDAWIFT